MEDHVGKLSIRLICVYNGLEWLIFESNQDISEPVGCSHPIFECLGRRRWQSLKLWTKYLSKFEKGKEIDHAQSSCPNRSE